MSKLSTTSDKFDGFYSEQLCEASGFTKRDRTHMPVYTKNTTAKKSDGCEVTASVIKSKINLYDAYDLSDVLRPRDFIKETGANVSSSDDLTLINGENSCMNDTEMSNKRVIKGPWSKEEDDKLMQLINEFGPKNWTKIAEQMETRIGKQCRERWHNHLHPSIKKSPFTPEEDLIIINLHKKFGNRWSEISKFLHGRTDNAIKNHWNSALQKRMRKRAYSVESIVCMKKFDSRCCCTECVSLKEDMRAKRSLSMYEYNREFLEREQRYKRAMNAEMRFMERINRRENDSLRRLFERMTDNEKIASMGLLKLYNAL